MADLFDSDIGKANVSGVDVGTPQIAAPRTGKDIEIDVASSYDIANRQLMSQFNKSTASKSGTKSDESDSVLQDLSKSLINRYNKIDSTVTNSVERNRLKREADLAALTAAGDKASTVKSIIDRLNTKREARPDGLVNVIGSNGEILASGGYDKDTALKSMKYDNRKTVHEVLPNTVDTLETLIQLDSSKGGTLSEKTMDEFVRTLKDNSIRMKSISDNYHMGVNTLNPDQHDNLLKNAKNSYLGSVVDMMNIFSNPELLTSIQSGRGIDRSQLDLAMQQVKRDIIDEVTTQSIPVDPKEISDFIQTNINNINKMYDDVQSRKYQSLEMAKNVAAYENALHQSIREKELGVADLEAARPFIDLMPKVAAANEAITNQLLIASPEQKKELLKQQKTLNSLASSAQANIDKASTFMSQSSFNFRAFDKIVAKVSTKEDVIGALEQLSTITNHEQGWSMQPYVEDAVSKLAPKLTDLIKKGEISYDELQAITDQLGNYESYAGRAINLTGLTRDEYNDRLAKVTGRDIKPGSGIANLFKSLASLFQSNEESKTETRQRRTE